MKTIVGLVTSHQDAEDLIRELTANGFKTEDLVRVEESMKALRNQTGEDEIYRSVEEFFGTEEKPEVKDYYAEGVRRGGVLVSVFAEDEDIDRAAEIMIGHGVVDIEGWIEIRREAEVNRAASNFDSMGKESRVAEGKVDGHGSVRGRVRIYDHSSVAGTSTWEALRDRLSNNRLTTERRNP